MLNLNLAEKQQSFDVIPSGTIAKMIITIRPGNFINQEWTDGYPTRSKKTGSIYLDCECVITAGPFAKRKFWTLIGLHSPSGETWGNMGKSLMRGIIESAKGILPEDNSDEAQTARNINGFSELNGLEFLGFIGVNKDEYGTKNVLKSAITPDHKLYQQLMNGSPESVAEELNDDVPW